MLVAVCVLPVISICYLSLSVLQKSRVLSKGVPIEEHAAKVYTRAMFEKFGEIMFESGSYVVDEKEKGKAYVTRHIRSDRWETWSQVEFEVTIRAEDGTVVCECGLGEHMGMPCCHAVKVRFPCCFQTAI
jgi:hypothetical protein